MSWVPGILASTTVTAWSRGLSPQAPGGRLLGRCRLVRGKLLGGILACAWGIFGILLRRRPSRDGYLNEVDRVWMARALLEFRVRVT
jgi:hypothetical protein